MSGAGLVLGDLWTVVGRKFWSVDCSALVELFVFLLVVCVYVVA